MRPAKVAYGAGDREFTDHPNFLRMILGTPGDAAISDGASGPGVLVLETTLDDVPPQTLAYASERLFEAGALDVFTAAVIMKKGRSGHHVTVLGPPERFDELSACLVTETSTLGIRYRVEQRLELEREIRRVDTPWGKIRVKSGRLGEHEVRAWPEYEDCAAAARRHGRTLAEVQRAALDAYRSTSRKRNRHR
jgi:uncharacterized protein (DUF111 family)